MSKNNKEKLIINLDEALEEIAKKLRPEANAPGICVGASQSNTGTPTKSGGCTCTCCSHKSYYYKHSGCITCFAAGAAVSTPIGKVAIETLKVGDKVYAYSVKTGERVISEVTQTFTNTRMVGEILLVDGTKIIATDKHPFYMPEEKRYTRVSNLKPGDLVLKVSKDLSGKGVAVKEVAFKDMSPTPVFNFTVKTFHNYYVEDVLVHNTSIYSC